MFSVRLWAPFILYYLLITFLSHIPGDDIPTFFEPFTYFDKIVHFTIYFFLGVFLIRALLMEKKMQRMRRTFLYFTLISSLAALLDEYHQYFVPMRHVDFWDFVADCAGAFSGYGLYMFGMRFGKKVVKKKKNKNRSCDFKV